MKETLHQENSEVVREMMNFCPSDTGWPETVFLALRNLEVHVIQMLQMRGMEIQRR